MKNKRISLIEVENLILPDGYKLVKVESLKDKKIKLKKEIDNIIKRLGTLPSDIELIEVGKMSHPYYMEIEQINFLKEELKNL